MEEKGRPKLLSTPPLDEDPTAPVDAKPSGGLVLVADDEMHVRRIVRAVLEDQGFEVLDAGDGAEALQIFREHRDELRLVVLDLLMPKVSGEEVLVELCKERPDLPVILTSGYPEEIATRQIGDLGTAAFIKKPFRLGELTDLVDTVLRNTDAT